MNRLNRKAHEERQEKLASIQEAERLKLQELHCVAGRLLTTEDGEKFRKAVRDYCKMDSVEFDLDPQTLAYRQGQRNVFLTFFEILVKEKF